MTERCKVCGHRRDLHGAEGCRVPAFRGKTCWCPADFRTVETAGS